MLPILYQSSDLVLYSYPLLMGLGWGIAYQIYFGLLPKSLSTFKGQILYWGIFLFAWLGAKVLFLLTLPKDVSDSLIGESSFWIGGGFVFYGGLLASLIFLLLFKCWEKNRTLEYFWPLVPATVFGHAIGRIGCFLAGCCYGSETSLPWGIHLHGAFRHPTQLLESLALFLFGTFLLRSKRSKFFLISSYFVFYGILRFGIELLRGDLIRGEWGLLSPSQWISLGLITLGLNLYKLNKNRSLKALVAK